MKKAVIVSKNAFLQSDYYKKHNIDILSFPYNPSVDSKIADHADVSFFFDGDDTLFVAKEMEHYIEKLRCYCKNIIILEKTLSNIYPNDVPLNCVRIGRNFICNKKTVSKKILEHMKAKNCRVIDVKQGYTKCSVLPVTDDALITDDNSIAPECRRHGIDVLLISKGEIALAGYDYGFIGGAGGKISADTVLFNGDITRHSDFDVINKFLNKYSITFYGTDDMLTDIGSILPLYKIQE